MQPRTHWVFDEFFSDANLLRKKIDEHFDESIGRTLSLKKRTIWNYWYIEKLYTYFRTDPRNVFSELHETFMSFLRSFAAKEFGLTASNPFLSMYINGCGQGLHNDAANGRLGFVYSLTNWKDRSFEGGETIVHKFADDSRSAQFLGVSGTAFYHMIEPEFNRLVLFDDRLPHAVRPIQGTMNPLDARFVMHGHFEESDKLAYIEGSLQGSDLRQQWENIRDAGRLFHNSGYHGFVTLQTAVEASGKSKTDIKHVQLLQRASSANDLNSCLRNVTNSLDRIEWPTSNASSLLVYAICSDAAA